MSLIESLSGGVLLVLFLHWALGRLHVANYWRGVVSGALPSFMLLAYSLFHSMTLDVISIHLAIFLSAATVTTMIVGSRTQSTSGIHWTIKIMIAFFVVLFIVDGTFVSVSTNGVPPEVAAWFLPNASKKPVYTGFTGVTRHDENAASAENEELKKLAELRQLGWRIDVTGVSRLLVSTPNPIRVALLDPQRVPINGAVVTLTLLREDTRTPLPSVTLPQVSDGEYKGDLVIPEVGNWIMRMDVTYEGKHETIDRDVRANAVE